MQATYVLTSIIELLIHLTLSLSSRKRIAGGGEGSIDIDVIHREACCAASVRVQTTNL